MENTESQDFVLCLASKSVFSPIPQATLANKLFAPFFDKFAIRIVSSFK